MRGVPNALAFKKHACFRAGTFSVRPRSLSSGQGAFTFTGERLSLNLCSIACLQRKIGKNRVFKDL
jgi:hypothetical protein